MAPSTKSYLAGIAAFAVLALSVSNGAWSERALQAERAKTSAAVEQFELVSAQVARLQAEAVVLERRASAYQDSARDTAAEAAARDRASRRAVAAARVVAVADTEAVFLARIALTEAEAARDGWHEAYEQEKAATGLLRAANDSLSAALAAVVPAGEQLADRAAQLVSASKPPGLLARLTPRTSVGVAVGVDITGRPNAVVGVTLGWRIG
jgi:hypothetical protein